MDTAVNIKDFETLASQNLPKKAYDYYRAGANACITLGENERAFSEMLLKTSAFSDPKDFKGL